MKDKTICHQAGPILGTRKEGIKLERRDEKPSTKVEREGPKITDKVKSILQKLKVLLEKNKNYKGKNFIIG